jgi:AraC family transcriptional regulator of adaptative response/methylated-DNA-[protein]-cysteine methyltransferase
MISCAFYNSPVGTLYLGANEKGIVFIEFKNDNKFDEQQSKLKKRLKEEFSENESPLIKELKKQLDGYFAGKRKSFDLPLQITGTNFQKSVWNQLLTIPPGETRSYKQQAENIGNPKAVRAVANANGDNLISIVIPCHRVIGSDGSLTGYGGGLENKKWLLEHENKFNK